VTRLRRASLGVALCASALAFAPGPSRSADAPQGVVGRGRLAFQLAIPTGPTVSAGGEMGFESRERVTRLDLLALTLPPEVPKALGALVEGRLTVVIDRGASRWVIWSNARRLYYYGDLPKAALPGAHGPSPEPTRMPSATPEPRGTSFLGSLKDLKSFYLHLDLTGHGTTNGHPTTGFTLAVHREDASGKLGDLTAAVQTADDLDGLPIQLSADFSSTGMPKGSLHAELTSIERRDPPKADFLVPAGFKPAKNPFDVLGFSSPF